MSNQIYDKEFYNPKIKERYLTETLSEGSRQTYSRVFKNSYLIEVELDRDLYTFTLNELKRVLTSMRPKNITSAQQNGAMLRSYIDWTIEQGYRESNINPLSKIPDPREWHSQFVDKSRQTLFHRDKIREVVYRCVNYQDKATVQLIFEGVLGTRFQELLNLSKHDIDFESRFLRLKDEDGRARELQVTEECINYVEVAMNETAYQKKNGATDINLRSSKMFSLVKNDYVLKKSKSRTDGEGKADHHLILRRLKVLKEFFGLDVFTAINIRNSGMLWMAARILKDKRKQDPNAILEKEDYDRICERFGISKVIHGGEETYNFFAYKSEFLNEEMIMEMYGDFMSNLE